MEKRLTQLEFDSAAAAWAAFIDQATPAGVQELFRANVQHSYLYQTYVSFDLATTIPHLLSTVGIRQVLARFVLAPPTQVLPPSPRFRVVLYAADQLGGRISAYYQGDAIYRVIPPKPALATQLPDLTETGKAAVQGLVPFSLIHNWLTAWTTAATAQQLSPALFATSYGPLHGYNFELGDFINQLFSAQVRGATQLYLNFGLKSYFPAYPETLTEPAQTFGLVVRLYSPGTQGPAGKDSAAGTESGPSYDMSQAFPPG